MDIQSNLDSLRYFIPEVILAGTILATIISDLFLKRPNSWKTVFVALSGVLAAGIAVIITPTPQGGLFFNLISLDPFARFFKVLFILATMLTLGISANSGDLIGRRFGEYYTLILSTVVGMFLLVSATDLLMIYLSLELVSIVSYVLAGYLKEQNRSNEAALKYVIYGGVSSGIMLFGFSLLFGLTGSTNITEIHQALVIGNTGTLPLTVVVIFVLAGFGFKIASVPFHFWAPDVYEGAPTPISGFLSVAPKAAGFAVLVRFFNVIMVGNTSPNSTEWFVIGDLPWPQILAALSAITMFLGNLVAIRQNNIKRMLAYSSIAHAGYILMGTVVLTQQGLFSVMFYLFIYMFINLGAFLIAIILFDTYGTEEISEYSGLGFRAPYLGVLTAIFMFALTGLPPTSGFVGKFYLFGALIDAGQQFYWLAVVGIINSVVSFFYYARVVKVMFFEEPDTMTEDRKVHPLALILLTCLAIPTLFLGIHWNALAKFTLNSLQFF